MDLFFLGGGGVLLLRLLLLAEKAGRRKTKKTLGLQVLGSGIEFAGFTSRLSG